MALSPVRFLFMLLVVSVFGWIIFIFAARLLAWFLSRNMGASVGFRVAGCNCLRDVVLKFKKGAVESVSIGEIKLSLRQSLVKLGFSFISRDPKLQVLICELEVVIRPSEQKMRKGKPKTQRPRSAGRGKWMVVANMARFLSVSVTELVVKVPKATIEVKDLKVDISKDGRSLPTLLVKLHLLPFLVHLGDSRLSYDQSSNFSQGASMSPGQESSALMEKNPPFLCEELSLSCGFSHDREIGIVIKNVDITSGEVTVNLNEDLFPKKKTDAVEGATLDSSDARKLEKKQNALQSLKKNILGFPEKVSFNLPKLDVKFVHRGQNIFVENNVTGIHLRSSKSQSFEESGETTSRLDVQMDFSEIHLLREGGTSVLEILKVAVISSFDVPLQLTAPVRAETDIKLGGTQFNIIMSRLKPWMQLHMSKKKKMVLREETPSIDRSQQSDLKAIMWTCTVSAPEMTIVLYSLSGSPLYHGCSQSSHLFANNIASMGIAVHVELGELHLHMAHEYQQCLKESLFGVETNSGSLMHIARVSLDWGHKEMESPDEHDTNRWKLMFSIDVTGMGVYFSFQRVESLISTAMSFQALLKSLSASAKRTTQNRVGRSSKPSSKGTRLLKFNLERCSVNLCGDVGVENAVVADPKRVNFGSQGGEVIISVSADGTPRKADVMSTVSNGCKNLKYSMSLEIFHFSLCANKEKQSTQMELERARSIYEEYTEEHRPDAKVTLFDMQNAKFVRRSGGHNEIAVCSLFSATDIAVRWEPDVHLSLYEFILRVRVLLYTQKLRGPDNEIKGELFNGKDMEPEKGATLDPVRPDKQLKKRESVFAVDVEMLTISAEVGDGVEAMVQVQSIFSENARIGILLEGLMLSFNEARVFKSSRMQISRIPKVSTSHSSLDAKVTTWDWVIQGLDVHICMPYRLQLRAIEDAVEEMLRGLKLISAAKTSLIFPVKKESSKKAKVKSSKVGRVRFSIRKLTADIEEEPIQGWLDEHYHLIKNEARELAVRLKFLDDIVSEVNKDSGTAEPNELSSERKIHHNGIEIDVHDSLAVQKLREEVHKQAFQSYYEACKKLVISEGSGACRTGFQAGFKPSTARTSLLSICATELDVTLTKIEGGDTGMIDFIKKLDPVCLEHEIPFSRMLGRNIVLNAGSLVANIRNYTFPIFSATAGKCEGRIVLAQQATSFQPQIQQEVFVGRWRKVRMLRSASGTTPPLKTYCDLPLHFQKAEVAFGVGFEPVLTDISYAFTVALRRANLSVRGCDPNIKGDNATNGLQISSVNVSDNQQPKKERSLPWWDEVRNYIHGKISLTFAETRWNLLGTTDPYEKRDKLQIVSGYMEIQQSDGRVFVSAMDFKISVTSLESLINSCSLKLPPSVSGAFLECPAFVLEVTMDWECDSGNPLNHYLYALPNEGEPRKKVYDPFRSTSLSLRWNFSLRPSLPPSEKQTPSPSMEDRSEHVSVKSPTMNVGAHDLAWVFKFWNMYYNPPHKLRSFSRWPRFGVPRVARSGNLSLDKVMTEFMLRLDATPTCIKHVALEDDDPASGLTFRTARLKYELGYSRGKQHYTFDCKRDPLDLVYQGLDLHLLKSYVDKENCTCAAQDVQTMRSSQAASTDRVGHEKCKFLGGSSEKHQDDGFLLSSDYFTIRRQAPKADPARLLAWQEAGRRNVEMTYVRSEFENGSDSDHTRSDPSDDDGFNVVIADNCQRVFVYGLKLLWTIKNRDVVWSWVGGISKAFEPPKPSPSRQYAQRKLLEGQQRVDGAETLQEDNSKPSPATNQSTSLPSPQHVENLGSPSAKVESSSTGVGKFSKHGSVDDLEEEGTRHFMVNVIQPQFNLHSEEANGRFLLAAASGRILARSFLSVLHVGYEMIEKALGTEGIQIPESEPAMTWNRVELSVMLEHVQAHVAPTDVDPGAGLQWLPKILRSSPKVKRTGALLERVFMPCTMYFRYTRHKSGTADLKVKPLKELTFNSPNIAATMTSRQFQVMLDVLSNLLFARLPKPRKSSLSYASEDDEDVEEEADEVVPDGVEEVELARIDLEHTERERKLLLDDIRNLSVSGDISGDLCPSAEKDGDFWMVTGGKTTLVQGLKKELGNIRKSRREASASLRMALQKAAQLRLMEKEKNKSPSYAMRISLRINKVVWGMLADGKSFAEAEINNMIYDFDRDYKDVGVAQFTTKSFVVRNCLLNAKSDMLLSAWNPPTEWGKKFMLRVDAKQGAPKDGNSPLELFQVEIYPLKIHLTETMYRMMWDYFFPEEEQDSQRRQEVWKVSTAGSRRPKKSASVSESAASSGHPIRESEAPSRAGAPAASSVSAGVGQSAHGDAFQVSKLQNLKANIVCGSSTELRRTSSFDRSWEETVAESVANELVLQSMSSTKSGPLSVTPENQHGVNEETRNKSKDFKLMKPGRSSHEEKKVGKVQEEKRSRAPKKMMEFHNIKISQVELLVTYEGSRFAVSDLRLLMDTFHRVDFTGTWRRLFSRVKKHIIWGVLKSVTGMQGKKFKDKAQSQREAIVAAVPDCDLNSSESDGGQAGKSDHPITWLKRPSDGAGDGFVTSVRGLFNSQRRKAKAFVLRTMRGEADNEFHGEWSESDADFSPFARQLTITKAKKLIRRHTKKFRSRGQKGSGTTSQSRESLPSSPRETTPYQSDSSSASSPYEDFHE
ncbi:protein SABRE [Magnolia sinica]|uniref:protein SABRE n=1 Tax=Magnolia sinica TaxID=86752 RepID=UPI00265A4077|nr:protein SABRE [Magnolia sinica]